jgi:hypothetical protein
MEKGESVDTWGATYFKILQIITFDGRYIHFMSIIIATTLYSSLYYFVSNLKISSKVKYFAGALFVLTPFVGVFAFTIGHDGLITSASLIYLTYLQKVGNNEIARLDRILVILAALLTSTSGLGVFLSLGFCFTLIVRKRLGLSALCLTLSAGLFLTGSSILGVEKSKFDMSIMGFLGDVKCIAQHPESVISDSQWSQLAVLGSISDWKEQHSCVVADYSFFAFENASNQKLSFIKLWKSLSTQNPQIALQARIQRTSVALPPPFFRNPPNMFDTSYENPVGKGAMSDLQIFPDLFKTSVDLPPAEKKQLVGQKLVESVVLLPTFLLNQRSDVWGWGGLWLLLALYCVSTILRYSWRNLLLLMMPLFALHAGIILFAPAPSPRYAFPSIFLGVFMVLVKICVLLTEKKSHQRE